MVARVNFQEILRHTFDIELRTRLLENLFFSFLSFFINGIAIDETWRRRNFTWITWWLIIDHSTNSLFYLQSLSSSTLFMIVNRKDDIDPSDTRFEWMVLVLLGNEFCIYTGSFLEVFLFSFVEVGLSRTFFARDWRWLACDRWWSLISCRGNWGSFVETPFLGRGSTYIDLYRWIFN